jgi:hypothetical protein
MKLFKKNASCLIALFYFTLSVNIASSADKQGLIGHWKLAGDTTDSAGGNHGQPVDVDFNAKGPSGKPNTAARFDGKKSIIEVPNNDSLRLGRGDFTFAVWAHTESQLEDTLGDLLSKFDFNERRGVNWCIKNTPGTSGSQSNYRNVHFGIDARTQPRWTDCGRPGNNVYVMALAVHGGELFAGTCEAGEEETGHVYRYQNGTRWEDCGSPDQSNAVTCLASHNGKLYAGTGRYKLRGSLLPDSLNQTLGGKVFCYEGNGKWTDCGQLGDIEAVGGLVTFRGQLYGSSMYRPGGTFVYKGGDQWDQCTAPQDGKRVASPCVFNDYLFAISYDGCAVYRFDGNTWSEPMVLEPRGQTYSLEVHGGELYASTWPNGKVYRSADGETWTDAGQSGSEREVMGIAVFNGKLYGGTLPLAEVYRYDGGTKWTNTGRLDFTPDVTYRRAWSMAVYQGRLFCGTLPAGHVHALEAGANVTYDHALQAGWRHLAVARRGKQLLLFVDGKLASSSTIPNSPELDISNDQPLKIGFGGHDYFNGCLSDLRIYNRALGNDEIAALAAKDR